MRNATATAHNGTLPGNPYRFKGEYLDAASGLYKIGSDPTGQDWLDDVGDFFSDIEEATDPDTYLEDAGEAGEQCMVWGGAGLLGTAATALVAGSNPFGWGVLIAGAAGCLAGSEGYYQSVD